MQYYSIGLEQYGTARQDGKIKESRSTSNNDEPCGVVDGTEAVAINVDCYCIFILFLIPLIVDGSPHHHPACRPISPRFTPYDFFIAMRVQHSYKWLNFTYSHSHAFRYGRKNTNFALTRIELTTSALAGVQFIYYLDHSATRGHYGCYKLKTLL